MSDSASTELSSLRDAKKRYEASFVRIAKAHGIASPLVLIAMAKNNEENYAEILASHIEQAMANEQAVAAPHTNSPQDDA